MEPTLLLDGVLGAVTALLFHVTGRALARRPVRGPARLAAGAYVAWWHAAAAVTALLALPRLLAGVGWLTAPVLEATLLVLALPVSFGLAALVYYLAFVATGSRRILAPIAAGYAAFYAALLAYTATRDVSGFATAPWSLHVLHANPPGGWPFAVLVTLLFAPPVLAVLGYLRLYRHAPTPTQRYRIALVSFSVVALLASGLVASEVGLPPLQGFYPTSRAVALVAAVGILLAYAPPSWVRRRLRVTGVADEPGAT